MFGELDSIVSNKAFFNLLIDFLKKIRRSVGQNKACRIGKKNVKL